MFRLDLRKKGIAASLGIRATRCQHTIKPQKSRCHSAISSMPQAFTVMPPQKDEGCRGLNCGASKAVQSNQKPIIHAKPPLSLHPSISITPRNNKMGITNDDDHEMSRLSNGGDEESLPLYSEVGGAPKEGPTSVPEATATPDEVRDFFKSLIVAKRQDVNGQGAETIAAKWTRGSGKELKTYPPAMYLKIFGPEDGWFLYKETKLIERTKSEKDMKRTKNGQCKCYRSHVTVTRR